MRKVRLHFYVHAKRSKNFGMSKLRILASYEAKIALLDILAYNSANNPYIQYPTKSPLAQCSILHLLSIGQKGFLSDFKQMVYIPGQNVQKLHIFVIFAS